eukprot:PITA_33850
MQIAHVFMQNIFKLHGLPKTIISSHDVKFTSVFWKTLFEELGTQLNFNTAYHPQTDEQTERVNQKCRTPSSWSGPEDRLMLGPEMLKEMEELVKRVCSNLKVAQDRKKNFVDWKRRFKEYQVGDHVYILARIGPVAYQLALPSHIRVHNIFHVSVLKKYVYDPKHVINWQEIQVEPEGEIWVDPLSILDQREVTLRKRDITQVKVQWQHFGPDEATWEDEELMKQAYPGLFRTEGHWEDV